MRKARKASLEAKKKIEEALRRPIPKGWPSWIPKYATGGIQVNVWERGIEGSFSIIIPFSFPIEDADEDIFKFMWELLKEEFENYPKERRKHKIK